MSGSMGRVSERASVQGPSLELHLSHHHLWMDTMILSCEYTLAAHRSQQYKF